MRWELWHEGWRKSCRGSSSAIQAVCTEALKGEILLDSFILGAEMDWAYEARERVRKSKEEKMAVQGWKMVLLGQ